VSTPGATDWLVVDDLAPSTGGTLAPLYAEAADGRLAMPFCTACAEPLELEQLACERCGAIGPVWRPVERAGVVHAVTTVHRREPSLLRVDEPYHILDVELCSGHRLIMTTEQPEPAAPRIGDPVRIGFRHVGGVAIPAAIVAPPAKEETT